MKLNMLPILSGAQNVLPIDYEQSAEQLLSGNDSFVFSDVVLYVLFRFEIMEDNVYSNYI